MTSNSRHGLPPRLMAHQPTRFATAQESKPSPSPGIRMTGAASQGRAAAPILGQGSSFNLSPPLRHGFTVADVPPSSVGVSAHLSRLEPSSKPHKPAWARHDRHQAHGY